MCLCSKAMNLYEILHYSYSCWFNSALLYLCTGNSKRTQAGVDGLLNGYVACGWGGGCGLNKKARDGFRLRAPRQSDGRVVHVRDAYATRRADILNTKRTEKVRRWRNNSWSTDYFNKNNHRSVFTCQCICLSGFLFMRLTLLSGDLSLNWPAGQWVFQGINVDFIGSCNLGEVRKRIKRLQFLIVLHSLNKTMYYGCSCNHDRLSVFMHV